MIDTLTTIINEYYQDYDIYKKLENDVREIITTLLDVNKIKISNMTLRIKSEEALKNKVISKSNMNIWMKLRTFSAAVSLLYLKVMLTEFLISLKTPLKS